VKKVTPIRLALVLLSLVATMAYSSEQGNNSIAEPFFPEPPSGMFFTGPDFEPPYFPELPWGAPHEPPGNFSPNLPSDRFFVEPNFEPPYLPELPWEAPVAPPQYFSPEPFRAFTPPRRPMEAPPWVDFFPTPPAGPIYAGPRMLPPDQSSGPMPNAYLQMLEQQLQRQNQQCQALEAENIHLKNSLLNFQQQSPLQQDHRVQLSLTGASMAALTAERDQLQDQLGAISAERDQALGMQQTLADELNALKLHQVSAEQNASQQNQQQQEAYSTLETERNELQTQLTSLQQKFEAASQQQGQQQHEAISQLETERNQLQNQLASLQQEVEAASQQQGQQQRETISQLETERSQLQNQLTSLQQEFEATSQQLSQQTLALEESRSSTASTQTQLAGERDGLNKQLIKLQQELDQLRQTHSQQQAALETAEVKIAGTQGLSEEITGLKKTLADREDEIGAMKMRFNNTESMMTGLKAASQDARDKLVSMNHEYKVMQEQLAATQAHSGEFETAIKTRDAEIVKLQNTLQKKSAEQVQLTQQLEASTQAQQKTQNLTASLQQAEAELQTRVESLTATEAKILQLEQQLKQMDSLQAEYKTCQENNDRANQRITSLEDENKILEARLGKAQQAQTDLEKMTADTDGDGVVDAIDICPNTGADVKVGAKGCEPDSDLDGLVDRLDLCPNTPDGKNIDEVGCHSEATITLEGVNFQSSSADFTAESLAVLDRVAGILTQQGNIDIEIAGHTDNTGSRELNIDLSATRATAVKNYLVEQGISDKRLSAYGYGPDQPIASNASAAGRAQNRRVELRRK